MKKIVVIGCPGSGKSTLSIKLNQILNIPLHHLDMMYWNSDKSTVERSVFIQRLENVLDNDSWIIDGNYISTMALRLSHCDTVIFLDYPTKVCLEGINERKNKPRPDMPWVEKSGEEDEDFIQYVKGFNKNIRPQIVKLLEERCEKRIIVLKSCKQCEKFLSEIKSYL